MKGIFFISNEQRRPFFLLYSISNPNPSKTIKLPSICSFYGIKATSGGENFYHRVHCAAVIDKVLTHSYTTPTQKKRGVVTKSHNWNTSACKTHAPLFIVMKHME